MKKSRLFSCCLLLLWLFASNREFYIRSCIKQVREYQRKEVLLSGSITAMEILKVHIKDPLLTLEGDDELYYKEVLYDIFLTREITKDSVEYLLVKDKEEQELLTSLGNRNSFSHTRNFNFSFNLKFVAPLHSFDEFILVSNKFFKSINYLNRKDEFISNYYSSLLQPPD